MILNKNFTVKLNSVIIFPLFHNTPTMIIEVSNVFYFFYIIYNIIRTLSLDKI